MTKYLWQQSGSFTTLSWAASPLFTVTVQSRRHGTEPSSSVWTWFHSIVSATLAPRTVDVLVAWELSTLWHPFHPSASLLFLFSPCQVSGCPVGKLQCLRKVDFRDCGVQPHVCRSRFIRSIAVLRIAPRTSHLPSKSVQRTTTDRVDDHSQSGGQQQSGRQKQSGRSPP